MRKPNSKSESAIRRRGEAICWANTAKLQVRELRKRLAKMPDPDNRALVTRFYMNELLDKLEANLDSIRAAACSPNAKLTERPWTALKAYE